MRLEAVFKFESRNPKHEIHPPQTGKNPKHEYLIVREESSRPSPQRKPGSRTPRFFWIPASAGILHARGLRPV